MSSAPASIVIAASQRWERTWVKELLAEHDHNVSQAARAAEMARSHLRQLIDRYDLDRPRSEPRSDPRSDDDT